MKICEMLRKQHLKGIYSTKCPNLGKKKDFQLVNSDLQPLSSP